MTSRPEPDILEMVVSLDAKVLPIHGVPDDPMIRFFEDRSKNMKPWLQKGDPMQRIPHLRLPRTVCSPGQRLLVPS
jgi:hypothetical protein